MSFKINISLFLFKSAILFYIFGNAFHVSGQNEKSEVSIIQEHLLNITKGSFYRNSDNPKQLVVVATYIHETFTHYSDRVEYQNFTANGIVYQNVICSFGPENAERIIVGAHYDVCEDQMGADDNASGVAGLLELARMLEGKELKYRIDLVAYSLEEPPFFRSEWMGSYVHAKSMYDQQIKVKGMISLEMIGYYSDEKKSQDFPIGLLSLFYSRKGNYITLVKKWGSGPFARKYIRKFKSKKELKACKFAGPAKLPGIDFSDHLNYWKFHYSALMITDTAFYRNKNYHKKSDTIETLDLTRMSYVINSTYKALIEI